MNLRRLGVLTGTFDPVHEGHLYLARQARDQLGLDGVMLAPLAGRVNWQPEATPEQRLKMCRLAIAGHRGLMLSSAGVEAQALYPAAVIAALVKAYPDARLTLILGADKLATLPYWVQANRLFRQCDFLCFPRPGVAAMEAMDKARAVGARVTLLSVAPLPYTATLIRARTAQYEDAPGLPRPVLRFMAENGLYQPDITPRLRSMMNAKRFRHTLNVRLEAVRLADLHGLCMQKAAFAGLLHDCAKGMPLPEMARIARENHLVEDEDMLSSGAMLHGPVGAYVAATQFGVRDEAVLNAIRSHTVGRPGMSELEKCVFVADAIEPGREDYPGLQAIRRLAEVSLTAAVLKSLQLTRRHVEETGQPFFAAGRATAQELEAALTETERQLLRQI